MVVTPEDRYFQNKRMQKSGTGTAIHRTWPRSPKGEVSGNEL